MIQSGLQFAATAPSSPTRRHGAAAAAASAIYDNISRQGQAALLAAQLFGGRFGIDIGLFLPDVFRLAAKAAAARRLRLFHPVLYPLQVR